MTKQVFFIDHLKLKAHLQAQILGYEIISEKFRSNLTLLEISVLKKGISAVSTAQIKTLVDNEKERLFICALSSNHIDEIGNIYEWAQEKGFNFPKQKVAYLACLSNNSKLITQSLLSLSEQEIKQVIISDNHIILKSLSEKGNLDVINEIMNYPLGDDLKVKDLLQPTNFQEFIQKSAKYGHLEVVKHFESQLKINKPFYRRALEFIGITYPENIKAIMAEDYKAFRDAATNGHLEVVKHFESQLKINKPFYRRALEFIGITYPENIKAIMAEDYEAFRDAATNGHLEIVKHFESKLSDEQIIEAIKEGKYKALAWAVANGHLEVIKYFESKLSDEQMVEAIKEGKYKALRQAAYRGNLEIIKYFESKLSDEQMVEAIKENKYEALGWAVKNGHLEVIRHFESKLSDEQMVEDFEENTCEFFLDSVRNGHLKVIQHFEEKLSDEQIVHLIQSKNYGAIRWAVENGHLEVIKHFESKLSDEQMVKAIKIHDYHTIKEVAENNHLKVINHLLTNKEIFSYMENHDLEYGKAYIYDFVRQKLQGLLSEKNAFEKDYPNDIFNTEDKSADYYLALLHNLIRRSVDRKHAKAEELSDDIRLLLSIPSVRKKARAEFNDASNNRFLSSIVSDEQLTFEIEKFARKHFQTVITRENSLTLKEAYDVLVHPADTHELSIEIIVAQEKAEKKAKATLRKININQEELKESLIEKYPILQLLNSTSFASTINRLVNQNDASSLDFCVFKRRLGLEDLMSTQENKVSSDASVIRKMGLLTANEKKQGQEEALEINEKETKSNCYYRPPT